MSQDRVIYDYDNESASASIKLRPKATTSSLDTSQAKTSTNFIRKSLIPSSAFDLQLETQQEQDDTTMFYFTSTDLHPTNIKSSTTKEKPARPEDDVVLEQGLVLGSENSSQLPELRREKVSARPSRWSTRAFIKKGSKNRLRNSFSSRTTLSETTKRRHHSIDGGMNRILQKATQGHLMNSQQVTVDEDIDTIPECDLRMPIQQLTAATENGKHIPNRVKSDETTIRKIPGDIGNCISSARRRSARELAFFEISSPTTGVENPKERPWVTLDLDINFCPINAKELLLYRAVVSDRHSQTHHQFLVDQEIFVAVTKRRVLQLTTDIQALKRKAIRAYAPFHLVSIQRKQVLVTTNLVEITE